jgi:predicted phosphate transport protein (TIGR00153 family)
MVRLIPRDEKFLDAFILDVENLLAAARALEAMLTSYDRLDERVAEIQTLEKRGDEIDHDIASRLERSFITPFDRDDIHGLAVQLDDVVDLIQSAAETCVIYDISAPTPEMQRLATILAHQGESLLEAIRLLEGFKGVAPHLERIHDLEHEADALSREAIGRLFRERMDPLDVMRLREMYGTLEEAIDGVEDAAEVIEGILAKGT